MSEPFQSVEEFLNSTELVVSRETFGEGDAAFEVDLRFVDRRELDAMSKECMTTVTTRQGRQQEPNLEKLRKYLRDRCLVGWDGLTYGKLALLCNRQPTANGASANPVPYNAANAMAVLAAARGKVNGEVVNFEDWVWGRITSLAEQKAKQEGSEAKN